jgi:hypothetical protein
MGECAGGLCAPLQPILHEPIRLHPSRTASTQKLKDLRREYTVSSFQAISSRYSRGCD